MMKTHPWNTLALAALAAAGLAAQAAAQPVIDGTVDASYGAPLSVQTTRTGFGNASNPDALLTGGGSEIDAVYAQVSGDRLYIAVAGNLEENFNKLALFIDTGTASGVNRLDGAALPPALDSFCCGGLTPPRGSNTAGTGALQRMNGFGFDAGFTANSVLLVTNGNETVNPGQPDENRFYAVSAHFADLDQGTSGRVAALGMQLAPRGLPNALRGPGDYNKDGALNAADYTLWRDTLGAAGANGAGADGSANGLIDQADYDVWAGNYERNTSLSGFSFSPSGNPGNTEALIGPTLPGLGQGQLIDRAYAQSSGGCTGDTGAGCVARELEFALDVDPAELGTNTSSHRNFNNVVDLRLAIDNSNTAGVTGSNDPFAVEILPGDPDNPGAVRTGVELSIPLSQLNIPVGSTSLRILALVNGGGHDFLSNQFSGAGVLDANLGTALFSTAPAIPQFSLADFPGDQFVTLGLPGGTAVPEPTALALVLAAGACVARRNRG